MRILISLLLCLTFISCSKKDEQVKKIEQDLKIQEQKLQEEKSNLDKIAKQKEEELNKAKEDYDKAVKENNEKGKYPGKYPFASAREMVEDDLKNLSEFDRRVLKNEILARHGFIFQNEEMKSYFSEQKWYKPKSKNVDKMLTDIENHNIEIINTYEMKDRGKTLKR
jgi:hypothetical protein